MTGGGAVHFTHKEFFSHLVPSYLSKYPDRSMSVPACSRSPAASPFFIP